MEAYTTLTLFVGEDKSALILISVYMIYVILSYIIDEIHISFQLSSDVHSFQVIEKI